MKTAACLHQVNNVMGKTIIEEKMALQVPVYKN